MQGMAPDTVPKLFFRQVRRYGDRVALRRKELGIWSRITWREYGESVRQVGMGLVAIGLRPGDHSAIIGDNRPEWLYADLGNLAVGGISVGVYTTNSPEEVKYVLAHSSARFFFVEDEEQLDKVLVIREGLPNLDKVIVMDMEGLKHFHDPMVMGFDELLRMGEEFDGQHPGLFEQCVEETRPEGIATLVYTSGTTGPPKAAMLSHLNVLSNSHAFARHVPAFDTDVILSYLPLCHIGERTLSVYHAINMGFTVFFAEGPDTVPENLREVSPTFFFGVPRIWEKFHSAISIGVQDATWFKRQVYRMAMGLGKKAAWAEMARKVAHEIKNPLTPIQLSAEHLLRVYEDKRGDFDHALKESLSYIIGEVENLRRIAQEFLEISKEAVLHIEAFALDALVKETVEPYKNVLTERIRFSEAYEGADFRFEGDRSKLKIALRNLLTNAIEAIRGRARDLSATWRAAWRQTWQEPEPEATE